MSSRDIFRRGRGYRLLMEALARRDNVAEALRVYEELRQKLRDELGADPSSGTQELHRTLLAT
jgi:SARP family transcriptional regulator, regulator of embCAB operon